MRTARIAAGDRSPAAPPPALGRSLAALLAAGTVLRLALLPITHGQDFVVWDLASRATLRGVNIYAHHPHYPGGPYAYFPLFLYVELPLQWLAQHTAVSFVVLGKLPMVAGDVVTTVLLAQELRRRGVPERFVVAGAALFFLDPLVVYDSAYYGRFDGVALAALLLALRASRQRRPTAALWFAVAVATKTFPLFALAGFVRHAAGARRLFVVTLAGVLTLLCAPYLLSLRALLGDIVGHDLVKGQQALSWQTLLLHSADAHMLRVLDYGLLASFALGTIGLLIVDDLAVYCLAVLTLFVLCSKVVLEQYLVWLVPLLVIAMSRRRIRPAAVLLWVAVTAAGILANPDVHPWGRSPVPLVALLAVSCLVLIVSVVRAAPDERRLGGAAAARAGLAST